MCGELDFNTNASNLTPLCDTNVDRGLVLDDKPWLQERILTEKTLLFFIPPFKQADESTPGTVCVIFVVFALSLWRLQRVKLSTSTSMF